MDKASTAPLRDIDLAVPNHAWGIFLVSVLGLFLELIFIRWIGTEIRIFAYLQNTVLVACILGLGLGAFTSAKPIVIRQSLICIAILLGAMTLPWTRSLLSSISEILSASGGFLIWYAGENPEGENLHSLALGLVLTYAILILLVDTFVPIGRILGRLMNTARIPILAYSINIAGSLVGTWLLVLLSFYYQPPFTWYLAAALLMLVFVFWTTRDRRFNLMLIAGIVILSLLEGISRNALDVIWSPYQKLVVYENNPEGVGEYIITVNNVGYQALIDLSVPHVTENPDKYAPRLIGLSQYDLPALLHPDPASMLIVGAGTGNDAAGALRHGVESVTAVEIDPAILTVGAELHPEHPYSFPQVRLVNDDARSFFATTRERYDVISFGLLDSHTTTALTNARLDHYVYTIESIQQAGLLLNEDGILVLSFEARKPYIADRIRLTLVDVFHQEPIVFRIPSNSYGWGGVMFVTGDMDTITRQLQANPMLSGYIQKLQADHPLSFSDTTRVTTDDWPYIYLEAARIPSLYFYLIALMVVVFIRSYIKWNASLAISAKSGEFWHFFFLGTAFLLLEVQNISKASVVLGNTWEVNSIIISGILSMALLANWIAYRFPKLPILPIYALLIGSCVGLYFIDLARFGFMPYPIKAAIVGVLTSLPMLFSGIVFVRSFSHASEKSSAFGANLIGSLVGALLQSVTFVVGIKALLLIVAGFYLFSFLAKPANLEPEFP